MSTSSSSRAHSDSDRNAERSASAKRHGPRHGGSSSRRTLPSYRANPRQQINILLALADLAAGSAGVQRVTLAQHARIGAATVGDCMAFLADIGLVEAGRGQYAITEQGRAFAAAWPRERMRARLVLRPLLQAHWSATAAAAHLAGGPLPQEELARLLRTGLLGVPMRGTYMVEWLDIALIVERDTERLQVRLPTPETPPPPPAPGTRQEEESQGGGQQTAGATNHTSHAKNGEDQDAEAQSTRNQNADGAALLLGMPRAEIRELPDAGYTAFLEGVVQIVRGTSAPTT